MTTQHSTRRRPIGLSIIIIAAVWLSALVLMVYSEDRHHTAFSERCAAAGGVGFVSRGNSMCLSRDAVIELP
jgi:hypothetical protein